MKRIFFYQKSFFNFFLSILLLVGCAREITTPLIDAVKKNDESKIKNLIASGVNINQPSRVGNYVGNTPLSLAIYKNNCSIDIIRLIVDNGADINYTYWPPLQVAAYYGRVDVVNLLLEKGADIYLTSSFYGPNFTALDVATQQNQNEVARILRYKKIAYEKSIQNSISKPNKDIYSEQVVETRYIYEKKSDVDINIPINEIKYQYRFALIIGNEDYTSYQKNLNNESNVIFARNDASSFKEYAINALGIPDQNIIFLLDATTGQINQAISKINLIIKNTQGKAEVFVYYAGHGLPDENTKDSYIIPVDVSGMNVIEGVSLKTLYSRLVEFPSKRITLFIDACFSGGARNQGLLSARGVKVKPKDNILNGNIIVFSASSGEQSSLPLKDKFHGIFTYYLLKKIQETKGNVNYDELSRSINENVSLQSLLVNDKEQTPQVNISNSIQDEWKHFNLK